MGERMLTVSDLSKRHGDRLVLDRVSFVVNPGDRIGLVGPNGAGKSTLLAILAGEDRPDAGAATFGPGVRVGHLPQGFADLPGTTLAGLLALVSQRVEGRDGIVAEHDWGHLYELADDLIRRGVAYASWEAGIEAARAESGVRGD